MTKIAALPGLGISFACLLLIKILISGWYLQSGSVILGTPRLALAIDEAQAESSGDAGRVPSGDILGALKAREQALAKREQLLNKREKELEPLKLEIESKMAELNELQASLTEFAKKLADREKALEDKKIGHLVALYSAMEPAKAAAIMAELKLETIVRILRQMKGKSAGQIMGMMKPERGAIISEKLSQLD